MKLNELSKSDLGSVQERFGVASDVYEDENQKHQLAGGWQRAFTSEDVPGLGDRGFYGAVYKRTINGKDEHIISFRGFDDFNDLDDVGNIAIGRAPGQFSDAYSFVMAASQKLNFNPAKAEYIGHSMGGYLAKAVGLLNGSQKITAFNSPGLFNEDLQGLPKRVMKEFDENKADITDPQIRKSVLSIDSKFDIISWVGQLRGNTVKIDTLGKQHNLSSLEQSFNRAAEGVQDNTIHNPVHAPAAALKKPPVALAALA